MSGIFGMWNLDGRPVEQALLARMSATMAHRGADGEGLWSQGPVGLGCQLFRVTAEAAAETQPLVHPSGVVLVFDGRLDNREELLADLKTFPDISAGSSDAALILAAYRAFGEQFPERLNGDFALGLYDANRRQLLLARDAIGVRPLYYYRTGGLFLFASEIKALLVHPRVVTRPNDDLLASFLVGSLPTVNHGLTFFEGVSSLVPAHLAKVTSQGFASERYWDFDPARRIRFRSFPEYAEAFRHHFEGAVRRRLRSAHPVAVSVSGGLDSSSIMCLGAILRRRAPDLYPPVLGFSYTSVDGSPSDEKAFLLDIEQGQGLAIERVFLSPAGPLKGSGEQVWHIEGPCLVSDWSNTRAFHQIIRQSGARVLLTGHWGDQVLCTQAYLVDLFRRAAWMKVRKHLKSYAEWCVDVDAACFRTRFFKDLLKYHVPDALIPVLRGLRDRLHRDDDSHLLYAEAFRRRAYRPISGQARRRQPFATVHAKSLHQLTGLCYKAMCLERHNKVAALDGLEAAFPFLDRDVVSFLMGIPGDMQTWNGIHKAILREGMRGVLPDSIRARRWKADFAHQVNEGMEQDYPELVARLQAGGVAAGLGYVSSAWMQEVFGQAPDRFHGPTSGAAWTVYDLLGLDLWLQVFFSAGAAGKEGYQHEQAG